MRMWHKLLTPCLCRNHLLGCHNELHKFKISFDKKHNIKGRIYPVVQIEPWRMGEYHAELVSEMLKRGYNHQSNYIVPDISYLADYLRFAEVDLQENINTLTSKCVECAERIKNANILP